jgi:hypothetical protein
MVSRKGAKARITARERWARMLAPEWGGVAIAAIASAMLMAAPARAQTAQPGAVPNANKHQEGALLALGQNYPNPFSPATRIPFAVGDPPGCSDAGRRYHVSLKVYNLLAQLVAIPVMAEGSISSTPVGQPVQGLELPCGQYTAYWDGTGFNHNRAVASGLYLYRLEVNGKPIAARKMLIQR